MKQDNILQLENLYKNFNLEAGFFAKKQKTMRNEELVISNVSSLRDDFETRLCHSERNEV